MNANAICLKTHFRQFRACTRTVLSLGCLFLVALCLLSCSDNNNPASAPPPVTAAQQFMGCYSPGMSTTSNDQCGIVASFGDPTVDAGFSQEVAIQSSFWSGIPANAHPWNDCQSPNAVSLPTGDILFGVNLFQKIFVQNNGDTLPLAGVIAHEWGHQIQFDNGWMVQTEPTVRPIELEADAFSGYYMALAKGWAWAFINDYFSTMARFGSYDFTNPSFHGTPQERVTAAQLGFNTAANVLQTGQSLSYVQLHQIFSSAIQTFSAHASAAIVPPASADGRVREVLENIDRAEMRAMLLGKTTGRNVVLPPPATTNREALFPHR